jgi:3-oxoacyl-[acyl-carrier protein] reductase
MNRIIVTGAAQGIGRATTHRLLKEGYDVVAVDVDRAGLEQLQVDASGRLAVRCCNVAVGAEVATLFSELGEHPAEGLVNNAGIYLGTSLERYADDEIARVLGVNLMGAILMSRHFAALLMGRRSEGVIVNMGSSSMYGGSDPVYSATKAGLVGLTKACAKVFAPRIRVNLVAPGIVETGMFATLPADVVAWYRNAELVKKPLVADDVANTIAFLLSDNARNYTGAVFDLNNGFHL